MTEPSISKQRREACRTRAQQRQSSGGLKPSDLLAIFFGFGMVYLLAGATVGTLNSLINLGFNGRWLAMHLIFLGGVSQLIIGAAQFFAGAFLATGPPSRRVVALQLLVWNLGVICIAIAGYKQWGELVAVGAVVIGIGLALFAAGLNGMKRISVQRMPWATRWYLAATCMLAAGAVFGAMLANWVRYDGADLYSAHIVLNLIGWFGTTIIGTLHTLFPSLTATTLRFPKLQKHTFRSWIAGVVLVAFGYLTSVQTAIVLGWAALLVAGVLLTVNMFASLRGTGRSVSSAALAIAAAQGMLLCAFVLILVGSAKNGTVSVFSGELRPLLTVLLAGWLGLTVSSSLLHLLGVLYRIRKRRVHN